jgi:uncharacterized protein YheU (UPF0270 family)
MPSEPRGDAPEPVEIPLAALAPDVLRGVIEAFVLREGTDYGERERTLEEKVADVRRQLERGEARIVFDPETETVDIVRVR